MEFTTSAPLFHIATSFIDDSDYYPESVPGVGRAPYALGNEGVYEAILEMCSLTASASTTAFEYGGPCTNWDGNSGYWVDASTVDSQLPLEQRETLVANGGDATGDIALPTTGLFDDQDYARTFRFYVLISEVDTNTAKLGSQRSDVRLSAPFTAVVSPEALVQLNVLPYTILYQPPGDMSTVSYAVGSNYGTAFTVGNTKTNTNTSTSEESSSVKFSEAFSFFLGYSLGDTGTFDHSDTQGYGVTGNTTTTVSQSISQGDTIATGPDLSLVPGDGDLCLSPTNCPTNGPYTQVPNMVSHEPFWDDEFVLLVHLQFALYDMAPVRTTMSITGPMPSPLRYRSPASTPAPGAYPAPTRARIRVVLATRTPPSSRRRRVWRTMAAPIPSS